MSNCIIAQSGGPTSVINSSVVGLLEANKTLGSFNKVFAGLNGIEGILNGNIIELSSISQEEINNFIKTSSAMINEINNTREEHIITLEDPIEYLHNHNKCIINQREIGRDSKSYNKALKAVLREDPDVILVGEIRDLETISIAITAAETGHLVFSTLHTIGAVKTIDRIIDVFPPHQQEQVKIQLSSVIQAVISQQLLPNIKCNGRVAALEIMVNTPGIQNLIREGKTNQIESVVQTGNKYGMKTMDMAISELYKKGAISMEIAMAYAVDREILKRFMIL